MGIFDRLSTLLKSNINELISSAENPEKMLNQIIVDMRSQLVKAKQQVAAAIADEKRLRDQADAELRQAQDWENRAVLAVREGRDDLAKQALVRQNEHLTHGQALEGTWQTHRDETEKLKNALRDLNDKIEEAKRKKNLLIARQRRAQAQKRIAETMSALSEKSAFEAFARMEEKIDQSERQIRASAEIDEEFTGDRLAKDFKQLEQSAGANDADFRLLQLKQQMGLLGGAGAPAKQIGAGAAPGAASPGGTGTAGVAQPVLPGAGSTGAPPALPPGVQSPSTTGAGSTPASGSSDGIPTADVEEVPNTRKPA
jgi:phage shock protein A